MDCLEYMAGCEDNAFDLAIVDPPYGIDVARMNMGSRQNVKPDKSKDWDEGVPDDRYFSELQRVSREQIIWGGNYFRQIWPTRGFIVWDKGESMYGRSFAECEQAWTSFDMSARIYKKSPMDNYRIHPTQKPVDLYHWCLKSYAEPGQRILDTHLGSGSSAIAAHYFGCDFVGTEIDPDYFQAAQERFDNETKQVAMF